MMELEAARLVAEAMIWGAEVVTQENDRLAAIVRAVAAKDAPMKEYETPYYAAECRWCDGDGWDDHESACPWRLAREWAAEQPPSTTCKE